MSCLLIDIVIFAANKYEVILSVSNFLCILVISWVDIILVLTEILRILAMGCLIWNLSNLTCPHIIVAIDQLEGRKNLN